MDVLITREAAADLEAWAVLHPERPAWGLLLGHARGFRFIVERAVPSGGGTSLPSAERLESLAGLEGRQLVGLFAARPNAALRRAARTPFFCGRIFLDIRRSRDGRDLTPYLVEFDRRFFFTPIALSPARTEGKA